MHCLLAHNKYDANHVETWNSTHLNLNLAHLLQRCDCLWKSLAFFKILHDGQNNGSPNKNLCWRIHLISVMYHRPPPCSWRGYNKRWRIIRQKLCFLPYWWKQLSEWEEDFKEGCLDQGSIQNFVTSNGRHQNLVFFKGGKLNPTQWEDVTTYISDQAIGEKWWLRVDT